MNLQQQVVNWWHLGRNYQTGLMLFAQASRNKILIHYFMKKSERFGKSKLEYELTKAVGLNRNQMPPPINQSVKEPQAPKPKSLVNVVNSSQKELIKTAPAADQPPGKVKLPENKPSGKTNDRAKNYPKVVSRLKYEYSNLYNQRSLLHKQMRSVPDTNTPENINKRALLFHEIESITDRMEFLYRYIQNWEKTGIEPLEEEIWPQKKEEKAISDNPDQLKKMKKNLQSANTKDRNMLQFQNKSKSEKDNPMPAGPKRQKIEFRIKKREKQIFQIDQRIVELENNLS